MSDDVENGEDESADAAIKRQRFVWRGTGVEKLYPTSPSAFLVPIAYNEASAEALRRRWTDEIATGTFPLKGRVSPFVICPGYANQTLIGLGFATPPAIDDELAQCMLMGWDQGYGFVWIPDGSLQLFTLRADRAIFLKGEESGPGRQRGRPADALYTWAIEQINSGQSFSAAVQSIIEADPRRKRPSVARTLRRRIKKTS
jgi:hypothetical protein